MKDNEYFNRFLQYIGANLIAAICYFAFSAILGITGYVPGERAARFLSSAVTLLPFAVAIFVFTLRDKALPRRDLAAYFAGKGKNDLITFSVWALLGASVAVAGEAMGMVIYLFLAQALSATSLIAAMGTGAGLIAAVLLNIAVYAAARALGVLARR